MTNYDIVKSYLEIEPRARERKNLTRAMVNLLLNKYPELKDINKDKLIDFCRDYDSYIREWREVTRLEINLRGKDYDDGKILSQKYQLKRGYEPNYYKDNRQLKMI